MKKFLILSLFAFAFVLPIAHAQNATGYVPLAPIPGLTSAQDNISADTLANFLNNLYKYLIGLAAVLAVIQIIRGGFYIMGQESVTKKGEGRHLIQQAILGLVLVLLPALVFSIINPAILNLSISSFQPIKMEKTKSTAIPSAKPDAQTSTVSSTGALSTTQTNFICSNGDCTSAYPSALQACNGAKSQVLMACVPAQTDPTKLDITHSVPFPDNAPMKETCPAGQELIVSCPEYQAYSF